MRKMLIFKTLILFLFMSKSWEGYILNAGACGSQKTVFDTMEQELKAVGSSQYGLQKLNSALLQEQLELLTVEPFRQSPVVVL